MKPNIEKMPAFLFKWRFLIAIVISLTLLLLHGCKKKETTPIQDTYQQYFEENVLNRDYIVEYASDNGTNLTSQFNGYVFKLFKNTFSDGPMTAIKSGNTFTGMWSSNDDYSKLVITLNQPSIPAEFNFINRQWRFTKKAFPVMELGPWGSTETDTLHMRRL
ncbi:MAG TPA: hypothetical protein VK498_04440 [Ferruginibacter sp.]|nr:hypothetical protein [Ferruginibacter sp.]